MCHLRSIWEVSRLIQPLTELVICCRLDGDLLRWGYKLQWLVGVVAGVQALHT